MAQLGYLGDILFVTNSNIIETPNNIQWSGSARFAEHQRHLNHTLTEFTGIDTDKMSFELTLTSELCVDVMGELTKIWTYERKATTLPLVIGEKAYGKYRWTIKNHKIAMRYFDSMGNLTTAIVSINLLEYLSV